MRFLLVDSWRISQLHVAVNRAQITLHRTLRPRIVLSSLQVRSVIRSIDLWLRFI